MRSFEEVFNRSGFSRFLNSPAGRIFRLVAGTGFLAVDFVYREYVLGMLSTIWSVLPQVFQGSTQSLAPIADVMLRGGLLLRAARST